MRWSRAKSYRCYHTPYCHLLSPEKSSRLQGTYQKEKIIPKRDFIFGHKKSPISERFIYYSPREIFPPAFSIAAFADSEAASAVTSTFEESFPRPRTLRNFPFARIIRRS